LGVPFYFYFSVWGFLVGWLLDFVAWVLLVFLGLSIYKMWHHPTFQNSFAVCTCCSF